MIPNSLDALYDEARPEPAFSNSDGYDWFAANCETCIHDREQRTGTGPGCPLVMVALMGRRPIQWLDGPGGSVVDQYRCIEYRHEDDGPAEPTPIPDPPGQLTLAPREKFEAVRMLTPLEPQAVNA